MVYINIFKPDPKEMIPWKFLCGLARYPHFHWMTETVCHGQICAEILKGQCQEMHDTHEYWKGPETWPEEQMSHHAWYTWILKGSRNMTRRADRSWCMKTYEVKKHDHWSQEQTGHDAWFLWRLKCSKVRARICKPFKEPRNRFPAWRNRFQGFLNVYKFGLWRAVKSCFMMYM
jgi:hypothetical protein